MPVDLKQRENYKPVSFCPFKAKHITEFLMQSSNTNIPMLRICDQQHMYHFLCLAMKQHATLLSKFLMQLFVLSIVCFIKHYSQDAR